MILDLVNYKNMKERIILGKHNVESLVEILGSKQIDDVEIGFEIWNNLDRVNVNFDTLHILYLNRDKILQNRDKYRTLHQGRYFIDEKLISIQREIVSRFKKALEKRIRQTANQKKLKDYHNALLAEQALLKNTIKNEFIKKRR